MTISWDEAQELRYGQCVRHAIVFVLILLALVSSGCGSKSGSQSAGAAAGSSCDRAGQAVDNYDVLAQGASRMDYLILLHKLQRDCPRVAANLGLTGPYLPRCTRLDQENCSMYMKH
jgi:hypothetical protein